MADNDVRALKLIQEAEKKSKSGRGFFRIFGNDMEEACELYVKAANLFKMAKKWDEAGKSFLKSAEIKLNIRSTKLDAISNYTDAANCFRKTNPEATVDCLLKTAEIYTDTGCFEMAAKSYVSIAEIYESDESPDIEKAMANYEKAADYYNGEEYKRSANECMLNIAKCAAKLEKYKKAARIYEEVGVAFAKRSNYSANDCFFKAMLCHLCKDLMDAQDALKRYDVIHPPFAYARGCKLIQGCVLALKEQNVNSFTNSVKHYDDVISHSDKWTTMMLLRIKKKCGEAENIDTFPDKVEGVLSLVVCCAQSEWTIPKFTSLVRMKQNNISHYFQSLRNPDVIWQLLIDTCRTDIGGDGIPEICFKLSLTSGLMKLYRRVAKGWADVVVVLKVNSGQTLFFEEVLKMKELPMNQNKNVLAEFCTRNCRVKIENINKVLVEGALTMTCMINYCVWDESVIAKYEPNDKRHLKQFSLSEVQRNSLLLPSECVVIKVEDKSFNCHKKILAFHSPVFRSMFEHETKESETGILSITDHRVEAIGDLLAYMYLGQVENGDNIEELFEVANKYNVSHLKKICEQMLIKKLSIENVCRFMVLADLHSGSDLKKVCFEFCAENRKKIFQTNEWKMMKTRFLDLTNSVLEWMCNSY